MNDQNTTVADRFTDIHDSYIAGQTLAEIGERHGITRERVRQLLEAIGVERRNQSEAAEVRNRQIRDRRRDEIIATYHRLGTAIATVDAFRNDIPASVVKDVIASLPVAARPVRRPPAPERRFDDATCRAALLEAAGVGATSINAYRDWRETAGDSKPSVPLLIMRYGSWRKALIAAGVIEVNASSGERRSFDDTDIRATVRRFVAACDAADVYPSAQRYDEWAKQFPGTPSLATVRQRTNDKWLDIVNEARAK